MRRAQILARYIAILLTTWIAYRMGSMGTGTVAGTQPGLPPEISTELSNFIFEILIAGVGYVLDVVLHMKQDEEKTAAPTGLLFPDQKPLPPPPPPASPDVTLDPGEPFKFPVKR
jgi:hypothetical protein